GRTFAWQLTVRAKTIYSRQAYFRHYDLYLASKRGASERRACSLARVSHDPRSQVNEAKTGLVFARSLKLTRKWPPPSTDFIQGLFDRGDHAALHRQRPPRYARASRRGMPAAGKLLGDFADVHPLAFRAQTDAN